MKYSANVTEEQIFEKLTEILREAVPEKVIGEITLETSLVEDFGFDSVDTMDALLKIQDEFFLENERQINVDEFINYTYNNSDDKPLMVSTICRLIVENLAERQV